MIKAEKTIYSERINLIDTDIRPGSDESYIRQLSREDAILLTRSLLNVLLPSSEKDDKVKSK